MAYKMTKRGSMDNEITYEFFCDNKTDMEAIENSYRTLGSIAIVLEGESGGLEIYITNSAREWIPLNINAASASDDSGSSGGGGGLPSVTAVDNGKVLTVEEGAWAAATPSGGGAFIVKLTAQNTPGSFTSDKKASEIFNAAKTTPIVVIWDDSANEEYPDFICFVFCEAYIDNGEYGFTLFDLANFAPMTSTGNSANDYPVFSIQG